MELLIGPFILLVMIGGVLWQRRNEVKSWNGGVCFETGKPWIIFDTDSQGGRGYVSDSYCTWISYNVDNR